MATYLYEHEEFAYLSPKGKIVILRYGYMYDWLYISSSKFNKINAMFDLNGYYKIGVL